MAALLAQTAGALAGVVAMIFVALFVLGLPLALFEALFGPIGRGGRDGPYRSDRAAQELYERRLRDSNRR